jgi:hypothetical protein
VSKLIIDEPLLCYHPALVRKFGLPEAAVTQQLAYWLRHSKNVHDGHLWVYKTYAEWSDEIGISAAAARGALDRMRKTGVVIAIQSPVNAQDRTLWWRIDRAFLASFEPPDKSPETRPGSASVPSASTRRSNEAGRTSSASTHSSNARATEGKQRLLTERGEEPPADRRDQIPPDFPDELRPHARLVMAKLKRIAASHGCKKVWPAAVARCVMTHPRHPLVARADALEIWAVSPSRPIKDVVATYRTFLDKAEPLEATEMLSPDGIPMRGGGQMSSELPSGASAKITDMAPHLRARAAAARARETT